MPDEGTEGVSASPAADDMTQMKTALAQVQQQMQTLIARMDASHQERGAPSSTPLERVEAPAPTSGPAAPPTPNPRRLSRLPLMDIEPPTFDNSRPREGFLHIEVFIREIEIAMPPDDWTDAERRLVALQKLRGEAAMRIRQVKPKEFDTWEKLKGKLRQLFTISDMTRERMNREYFPRMREGEDIKVFIARASRDLDSLDPYSNMAERTRWNRIKSILVRTLPNDLKGQLFGNHHDVSVMIDILQEAWESYHEIGGEVHMNAQVATMRTADAARNGNRRPPPPNTTPYRGWRDRAPRGGGTRGRGRGEQRRGGATYTPQCHRCGRRGHLQARCHQTQCYACGRSGHLARECRGTWPKNGQGQHTQGMLGAVQGAYDREVYDDARAWPLEHPSAGYRGPHQQESWGGENLYPLTGPSQPTPASQ